MIIDIEILIFGIMVIIVSTWFVWYKLTRWWAKKKYNPENDKSRKAEEARKFGRREPTIEAATFGIQGLRKSEERNILPTTTTDVVGKTGDGDGNVSKKLGRRTRRNPFRKR